MRGLVRRERLDTRLRNQIHGILGRQGATYLCKEAAGSRLADVIAEAGLADAPWKAAEAFLRAEQAAQAEANALNKEVRRELSAEPVLGKHIELLATIPGVGFFSAALFVTELWDLSRFEEARKLASYIGFEPSTYQTGGTCFNGRMTKQGNSLLRGILVQDAWRAAMTNGFFGRLFERYRARLG